MKHHLFSASVALAVGVASCTDARAPSDVALTQDCGLVCGRMRSMGCDEGFPIEVNRKCDAAHRCPETEVCSALGTCIVSCVSFCVAAVHQGVWADVGCLKEIGSCSDIQGCPRTRCTTGACTTR